jgi:hypothetical protein
MIELVLLSYIHGLYIYCTSCVFKRVKAALVVPEGMQDLDLEDCDGLTGKG